MTHNPVWGSENQESEIKVSEDKTKITRIVMWKDIPLEKGFKKLEK